MRYFAYMFFLLIIVSCSQQQQDTTENVETIEEGEDLIEPSASLELLWETDTTLKVAESVLFDSEAGFAYVSCINGSPDEKNGAGFIAKIDLEGNIINEKWYSGDINAPKGMGLSGGVLFVTDIDRILAINTVTGEIEEEYPVEGAQFLNDIAIDEEGNVYISDSNTNKIHIIDSEGQLTTWLESDVYKGPNGLWVKGDHIYMAAFGDGNLYRINRKNKEITKISEGLDGGDGLEEIDSDNFVVSDWNGQVFHIDADGNKITLLDTRKSGSNAADIDYIPGEKIVLVPTFFRHTVAAYRLVNN